MKILFLIDTLEGYGAEKSLVEIAKGFTEVTPVFVHIYQGDMLKPHLEQAGIKVYSLDLEDKYAFNKALDKLIPIYYRERPDIVHATLFRSEIIARKLKKKIPAICLVGSFVSNAYSPERLRGRNVIGKLKLNYFFGLDRRTVKYVDYFISNSHTIKTRTGEALNIDKDKVEVIYRGRDSSKFDPNKKNGKFPYLNNQRIILLNVSRLIQLKGQNDLLKAMPQVLRECGDISLVFAGHGPYRTHLEREVKRLKLEPYIHFLGRIDNINKLLLKADVFLYPSYSEGLPGALIEAMMSAKTIICSDIPENLECVNEESALIYEKGNISALSDSIIKVLKDPKKYNKLGENARRQAVHKFELKKRISDYQSFYFRIKKHHKKERLRILHLIQKPQNRGAETFACQLANHQESLGNSVKIVSVFSGKTDLPWKGEIESLGASSNRRLFDLKAWKKLNEIIQNFQPDILQANAGDTLKYAVFSKKVYNWKVPIVFRNASEVGKYLKSNFQKKFNNFLYNQVDQVISVSNVSKHDIVANFPILKNKAVTIPIGIENYKMIMPEELKPSGKKHIIHVGGFTFEKNHEGLINIFEKILEECPDAHLHLLGDGPLRSKIEKLVRKSELEDKISFYGFVTDPLPYIKAANVLILPSIIEGLPGVLLESMFCETPVVAYDVGGISEIVNEETGIIVTANNEEDFSNSVLEILHNPNLEIIKNARKKVESIYFNSEIAKRFQDTYYYHF